MKVIKRLGSLTLGLFRVHGPFFGINEKGMMTNFGLSESFLMRPRLGSTAHYFFLTNF